MKWKDKSLWFKTGTITSIAIGIIWTGILIHEFISMDSEFFILAFIGLLFVAAITIFLAFLLGALIGLLISNIKQRLSK